MKKVVKRIIKTILWSVVGIIGLLIVAFLLLRYVFLDEFMEWQNTILQQEYVAELKASAPYHADSIAYEFTYVQDSVAAREINEYFRLDTIVNPASTTWENTLALAKFVSRNIPHGNQSKQPVSRNAIALWKYTREVEPAFNCRMHAIMMHELLMASGIDNRFITCLPADSTDTECHVVNVVWLPECEKWAMIDSDMQAWISDADGTPLSLADIRECYLSDSPMEIHPLSDADKFQYGYYRRYWSKNIYWFEARVDAGYDKETNPGGIYVALVPPGSDAQTWALRQRKSVTTDATRFWASPIR